MINGGLREGIDVLGKTDDLNYEHPWPEPTRGYEIKKYLEEHPEIKFYIIIDDETNTVEFKKYGNIDKITFKTPTTMETYAFNFTLFSTTNVVFAIWNGKKKKLGIISKTAQR